MQWGALGGLRTSPEPCRLSLLKTRMIIPHGYTERTTCPQAQHQKCWLLLSVGSVMGPKGGWLPYAFLLGGPAWLGTVCHPQQESVSLWSPLPLLSLATSLCSQNFLSCEPCKALSLVAPAWLGPSAASQPGAVWRVLKVTGEMPVPPDSWPVPCLQPLPSRPL